MEEVESLDDKRQEEALHKMLVEAVWELKAAWILRDRDRGAVAVAVAGGGGGAGGGGEGEEGEREGGPDEEECICKVRHVLREVSVSHSDRASSWRGALKECVCVLRPPGGSAQQPRPAGGGHRDSVIDLLLSVGEDVQDVLDKLEGIVAKLGEDVPPVQKDEASNEDAASPQQPEDGVPQGEHGQPGPPDVQPTEVSKPEETAWDTKDEDGIPEGVQRDNMEASELTTVGLGCPGDPGLCFVRGPPWVGGVLRCEAADALSCLMVCGSEELVSRVIRIGARDGVRVRFPLTVVVPFCGSYRGSYRDVVVKMVDGEGRRSYVAPLATEGTYGGQRGSFAEARVYSLGLFAVVSCLKKENYTVPTKGVSLRLNMDPRICLTYLPGCFAGPVIAQAMIQPMDTTLLAAARSRTDAYHSVVSTSPVLYLTHPSSQPMRRPLALTLPCPPNLQEKQEGGQEEPPEARSQRDSQRRTLVSSSKVMSDELLVVLGWRDDQWSVLEEAAARNLQKGLVTFELTESFDRLLVLRLCAPPQPADLAALAGELVEAARSHAVTLVLQRRPDEPGTALVAALPSRDLSWELTRLRAQGFAPLPEASCELSLCEGDRLVLRFSGNIAAEGGGEEQRFTFHAQLQSRVLLRLAEVDPFGNYSSPHYKGTAIIYKVTRDRLDQQGGAEPPGEPVCKLSLTLPKRPRPVNRQNVARVKSCEEPDSLSDSLLLWVAAELSEEEVPLLVPSLRLCRSAAQLVKLRAGDSPSAQAFHVLAMWRRGLPAAARRPKTSQLARCLARMGRPDLAGELLLREAEASGQTSEPPAEPRCRKMTGLKQV